MAAEGGSRRGSNIWSLERQDPGRVGGLSTNQPSTLGDFQRLLILGCLDTALKSHTAIICLATWTAARRATKTRTLSLSQGSRGTECSQLGGN